MSASKRASPLRSSSPSQSPTGASPRPADTGCEVDPLPGLGEEYPDATDASLKQADAEPTADERDLQRRYGSVFRMGTKKLLDKGGQQYFDSADWAKDKALGLPSDMTAKPKPKPRPRAPSGGHSELMPPPPPTRTERF